MDILYQWPSAQSLLNGIIDSYAPPLSFSFLLPLGNAQGQERSIAAPDEGYLLPKYPEVYASYAYWNGEFEVDVKTTQGVVDEIQFPVCRMSRVVSDPITIYVKCRDVNDVSIREMVQSIERVIKHWHVSEQKTHSFHLVVSFRRINPPNVGGPYTNYRIDGEWPPTRILIEYQENVLPPLPL